MALRHMTISDVDRLGLDRDDTARSLCMDEDAFRVFYEQTARGVWAYLARATRDPHAADDLLQETYYRFLRTSAVFEGHAHRRNYLFRIATNLTRDRHRRGGREVPMPDDGETLHPRDEGAAGRLAARHDVTLALDALRPRDRDLLWFAYAQGLTHEEIADALGLRRGSIKLLLFRARRRLAELLGRAPRATGGR
jgi:RNA polymerase sigma-70 factor (ECF subfamily)